MFNKFKRGGGENKKPATTADDDAAPEKAKPTPNKSDKNSRNEAPTKTASSSEKAYTRRSVAKPTNTEVVQKSTHVLYRLTHAVKQRPMEPSRSTELVPLTKEFDDMRKQLRLCVQAVRKYHQAMQEVTKCRTDVVTKTAKLSVNSPIADAVGSDKVVLGESLVTLDTKIVAASKAAATHYQESVLDYVVEWEAIVSKKIDSEVKYTTKLNKNLKHYESKLEKLRKTTAAKEEKGKVTPQMQEKLDRNEQKLKETWKEYEENATKTCHLLEEATKMAWKDLHPLVNKMIAFEYKRDTDEHALWSKLGGIKDKVNAVVDKHDEPLPASAFEEPQLLSRPSGDGDSGDDLEVSDEEE